MLLSPYTNLILIYFSLHRNRRFSISSHWLIRSKTYYNFLAWFNIKTEFRVFHLHNWFISPAGYLIRIRTGNSLFCGISASCKHILNSHLFPIFEAISQSIFPNITYSTGIPLHEYLKLIYPFWLNITLHVTVS